MKLKNVLRRIHPNSANLVHGRSPLSEINSNDLILARSMPPGAVHTNNIRVTRCKVGFAEDPGNMVPTLDQVGGR